MEAISNFLSGLASLAWPLLFTWLLYLIRQPIIRLIDSAGGRKFTLKVAGNELTMEENTEQQGKLLIDLQSKVAELEKIINAGESINTAPSKKSIHLNKRILWVDDQPKNNSYLMAALRNQKVDVDAVTSTQDALSSIENHHFDIIISDMGRPEGGKAGIDLALEIKQRKIDVPIYIFCGSWAATHLQKEATDAGVAGITSSGTTLMSMLPL